MKQLKITVNGKAYDVLVEEVGAGASATPVAAAPAPIAAAPASAAAPAPAAAPAAPAPAAAPAVAGGEEIVSPMPGTVLKINVSAGQAVTKGQVLLVFEAMKMENDICAERDGTVGNVLVSQGDSIDSGTPLITLL